MKALQGSPDGKFSSDALDSALLNYSEQCKQQAAAAVNTSQKICKALFCPEDAVTAMVQRMFNISDEDWLSRALMGLAGAPILENVRLST